MSDNRFPAVGGTRDVFYSRRKTVPLPLMDRAEGIRFWDENGREYVDASSGPMVSALGHGNAHVIAAMPPRPASSTMPARWLPAIAPSSTMPAAWRRSPAPASNAA